MVASVEQRLHHRIRDMEHRCNNRITAAINANNKTAAIQHTDKLLHHVIEEVQVGFIVLVFQRQNGNSACQHRDAKNARITHTCILQKKNFSRIFISKHCVW